MKPKDKGALGELRVAAKLIELGYPVFKEIANNSKVDLIILKDSKPIRIQVKTTTTIDGKALLNVRKNTLNKKYNYIYKKEDVDFFALWIEDKEDLLLISSEEATKHSSSMVFRYNEAKGRGNKKINNPSDYRDINKIINNLGL